VEHFRSSLRISQPLSEERRDKPACCWALNPLSDGEGITTGCDKSRVTGVPAQILYTSTTQVAAVVPASITGATAQVAVSYQGAVGNDLNVDVALSSPGIFTLNRGGPSRGDQRRWTGNTAANPVKIGGYVSLYATGWSDPKLPVVVTIGGFPRRFSSLAKLRVKPRA